jgi:hypothetical protein
MFFCIQNPQISLQDTCLKEIKSNQFDSIEKCLEEINNSRISVSHLPDLYTTGFCTTKTIQTI